MPPALNWPNPRSMNLAGAFAVSVQKQPQKTALFWGEREYSYTDLWRLSAGVAEGGDHGQLPEQPAVLAPVLQFAAPLAPGQQLAPHVHIGLLRRQPGFEYPGVLAQKAKVPKVPGRRQ